MNKYNLLTISFLFISSTLFSMEKKFYHQDYYALNSNFTALKLTESKTNQSIEKYKQNLSIIDDEYIYHNSTVLHLAAKNNDISSLKNLLELNFLNINKQDDKGFTALHVAVIHGQKESVDILIKYGADVNAKNKFGITALRLAIIFNHINIAVELIKANANTSCIREFKDIIDNIENSPKLKIKDKESNSPNLRIKAIKY